MPFPDLLQWIGEAKRSGALALAHAFEERYLRIHDGAITALGSSDPRANDLARLALARRLLDEQQLQVALATHDRTHRPLREILLTDGFVPHAALAEATRAHSKDAVLQVFLWDEGRFALYDQCEPSLLPSEEWNIEVDPPIAVSELLMDAMRRLDEWKRINEVFGSDFTVVHALGRSPKLPALESLAEMGEPLALGDLCMRLDRPRFELLEELYRAWQQGLLAISANPQQVATPRGKTPAEQLLVAGRVLLDAQQFDEAAALIRSALSLDPMNEPARKLLRRAYGDQIQELYREFPPYRVPRVIAARSHIEELALSPRDRFLLSRINGRWDVAALTIITPLGENQTLRTLKKLHRMRVIELAQ